MAGIIQRINKFILNVILIGVLMCLILLFLILLNQYNKTHYSAEIAFNEMKATEYKMKTEQYKMQTARLHLEVEEARLQAFLEKYGGKKND